MNGVKRYDPVNSDGTCGMCVEDADYGAYVEYADYAALEAELVELLRDAADYLRGLSLPAQLVKRIDAMLASREVKP